MCKNKYNSNILTSKYTGAVSVAGASGVGTLSVVSSVAVVFSTAAVTGAESGVTGPNLIGASNKKAMNSPAAMQRLRIKFLSVMILLF